MEPDNKDDYLDEDYQHSFLSPETYTDEFFTKEYQEQGNSKDYLPEDFVIRFGMKIIIYCERQQLLSEAMGKISKMIVSNLNSGPRMKTLFDVLIYFEKSEQTIRYVGITFDSIVRFRSDSSEQKEFYHKFLSWLLYVHRNRLYEPESSDSSNSQGYIAQMLSNIFINILKHRSEKTNHFAQFFSHIIKMELYELDIVKEKSKVRSPLILNTYTYETTTPFNEKSLHTCLLDYYNFKIKNRKSDFSRINEREIQELLEKLETVRSFTVQSIISQKSVEYNKMLQKELKSQVCTPEELIDAGDTFFQCIELFRSEKRYNFKYIALEDIRILSQLMSIVFGFVIMIFGILGKIELSIFQSLFFFGCMVFHGGFFFLRRFIREFYPKDLSTKLEFEIGKFVPYFKKMSKEQMLKFFSDKIKNTQDKTYYTYIPSFITYIYDLISNKDLVICTSDEIVAITQKIETLSIRKTAGIE